MLFQAVSNTFYCTVKTHILYGSDIVTLKKKVTVLLSVMLLFAFLSAVPIYTYNKHINASAKVREHPTVILDSGHGGFDGGAVAADGTVEKEINLKISLKLQKFLEAGGYEVVMTRSTDDSTDSIPSGSIQARKKSDLKNRLDLMSEYPNAIFVSIHLNKFTTSAACGAQVFYSPAVKQSEMLGKCIQDRVIQLLQPDNTRVIKKGTSSTYLLKNATVPAVIVECGFLSNHSELEKLKDSGYQGKMAFSVFCGIQKFFSEDGAENNADKVKNSIYMQ